MTPSLEELVGHMLGSEPRTFLRAEVRTVLYGEVETSVAWMEINRVWRLERSGVTTTVQTKSRSLMIDRRGNVTRGPRLSESGLWPICMFYPRFALIWGRPGEDWRLTSLITPGAEPDQVEIELRHTTDPEQVGSIVVNTETGHLAAASLGEQSWTITSLTDPSPPSTGLATETYRLKSD